MNGKRKNRFIQVRTIKIGTMNQMFNGQSRSFALQTPTESKFRLLLAITLREKQEQRIVVRSVINCQLGKSLKFNDFRSVRSSLRAPTNEGNER